MLFRSDDARGVVEILESVQEKDVVVVGNPGTLGRGMKATILGTDTKAGGRGGSGDGKKGSGGARGDAAADAGAAEGDRPAKGSKKGSMAGDDASSGKGEGRGGRGKKGTP